MKKQKVTSQINLERLAGGAFAEKLNEALLPLSWYRPMAGAGRRWPLTM